MDCQHAASKSTAFSAEEARLAASTRRGSARSSGFIILPVIWVVFFLALATAAFMLATRSHVRLAASAAASASAAALADAGINLALYDLANARAVRNWKRRLPVDGRTYICSIGKARIGISISEEAGKIDLNGADRALLVALFQGLGRSSGNARRLAAAIEDYRDPDDTRRPDGAEVADYREAGRKTGPKNAAFESPLELAQVLGLDRALLDKALPYVTVHTGLQGIDPTKASPALLEVLVAGFSGSGIGAATGETFRLPASVAVVSSQRVYAIRAQAEDVDGARFLREAIVRSSGGSEVPTILGWRQVGATDEMNGTDLGPC